MNSIFKILALIYIFFLPGFLMCKVFLRDVIGYDEIIILSIGLSVTLIPIFSFMLGIVCNTVINIEILLVSATIINILSAIIPLIKHTKKHNI